MKISDQSIQGLALAICGDEQDFFYRRGIDLVNFFNECGFHDIYPDSVEDAGSRRKYAESKLKSCNGTTAMKNIIERLVDPRDYIQPQSSISFVTLPGVVNYVNEHLKFDDFQLRKAGEFYKVYTKLGVLVVPESLTKLSHEFIEEQIIKCREKISASDFNGAITNARTLLEAVFIEIIERITEEKYSSDGNLRKIYNDLKKNMDFSSNPDRFPKSVIQVLSGLESIVNGLSSLSNQAADRHANKFNTRDYHAKLAVNSAMTVADFILDVHLLKNKPK